MRVKMLVDAPGSPDGVTVNEYTEGEVYEVTESLAAAFVANGLAVEDVVDVAPDAEPVVEPTGADVENLPKQATGPQEKE